MAMEINIIPGELRLVAMMPLYLGRSSFARLPAKAMINIPCGNIDTSGILWRLGGTFGLSFGQRLAFGLLHKAPRIYCTARLSWPTFSSWPQISWIFGAVFTRESDSSCTVAHSNNRYVNLGVLINVGLRKNIAHGYGNGPASTTMKLLNLFAMFI